MSTGQHAAAADGPTGRAMQSFVLHSPGLTIRACPAAPNWLVFSFDLGGVLIDRNGGDSQASFVRQLQEVLGKTRGEPLSGFERPGFLREVGDLQAEYLGYVVVSGYDTLYFFRLPQGGMHVVLADSRGRVLAHARVGDLAQAWSPQLQAMSVAGAAP